MSKDNDNILLLQQISKLKIENELLKSNLEAKDLLSNSYLPDTSSSILLKYSSQGKILFINSFGAELFGYSQEELTNSSIFDKLIIHPDAKNKFLSAAKAEFNQSMECEVRTKDNRRLWIVWAGNVICDENGNFVDGWAIGIDRTKQRKKEERILNDNSRSEYFQSLIIKLSALKSNSPEKINAILKESASALSADRVSLWLLSEDKKFMDCHWLYDFRNNSVEKEARVEIGLMEYEINELLASRVLKISNIQATDYIPKIIKEYFKANEILAMLDIIVKAGDNSDGMISYGYCYEQREWTPHEIDFAISVSELISLELEAETRRKAERKLKFYLKQAEEFQTAVVALYNSKYPNIEQAVKDIIRINAQTLKVDFVYFAILDEDTYEIEETVSYDRLKDRFFNPPKFNNLVFNNFLKHFEKQKLLVINDSFAHEGLNEFEAYIRHYKLRAGVSCSIKLASRTIGLLFNGYTAHKHDWTAHEVNFTASIADIISYELEADRRRKAQEALQNAVIQAEKFQNVIALYFNKRFDNTDRALKYLIRESANALELPRVGLWYYNAERIKLEQKFLYLRDSDDFVVDSDLQFELLSEIVIRNSDSRVTAYHNVFEYPELREIWGFFSKRGIKAILLAHIRVGDNLIGTLSFSCNNSSKFWTAQEINFAASIADLISNEIMQSEKNQVLNKLRHNEQRFRSFVENASDIIFSVDFKGIISYITPNVNKILGYDTKALIGSTITEIIKESHKNRFLSLVEDIRNKLGDNKETICQFFDAEGNLKWLRISGSIITDLDGNSNAFLGFAHDVTDDISSQESIKSSKRLLQSIFDTVSIGIALLDCDGIVKQMNYSFYFLFGYRPENMLDKPFVDFVSDDDKDSFLDFSKNILDNLTNATAEFKIRNKNNFFNDVIISARALIQSDAKNYLVLSVTDISDSKLSAQQLKLYNTILKTQQESSPDGIMLVDSNRNIISVNKRAYDLLEIPPTLKDKDLKQYLTKLDAYNKYNHIIKHLMEFTRQKQRYITNDLVAVPENKTYERYISPLIGPEKEYYGAALFLRDITKQKEFEITLKESKEAAVMATQAKSEFLANVSHEIRTPMNAILGFSQLLSELVTDKKQQNYINAIVAGGKNLLDLINDILDLSKIETGKLELRYDKINISDFLRSVTDKFRQKAAEKGIEFITNTDSQLPEVIIFDEIRLRQILINLIGNAIKFTEKGFVKVTLNNNRFDKVKNLLDMQFIIEDTGIGIEESKKDLIFESFSQQIGSSTRSHGGTGLGLAITKRLTEMMGGQISVDSIPGKGSLFSILLQEVKVLPQEYYDDSSLRYVWNIKFKEAKVLIIDTNPINRELIKDYLANKNLQVFDSDTISQGLEFAKLIKPDLILTRSDLIDNNGISALALINEIVSREQTTIIVFRKWVSDNVNSSEKENINYDDELPLDFDKSLLISTLMKYLPNESDNTNDPDNQIIVKDNYLEYQELPEDIDKLKNSDIYQILSVDFLSELKQIRQKAILSEMKSFAIKLKKLSGEYPFKSLEIYSKVLLKQIKNFEFEKFPKTLDHFQLILDKLKNIIYTPEDQ